MKPNRCLVLSILALSLFAIACDKKDAPTKDNEATTTAPAPKTTEPEKSTREPSEPEPDTPPAKSTRVQFHNGRFFITLEGAPTGEDKFQEANNTRTSRKTWSSERAVFSINVNESMLEGPDHVVSEGMLDFVHKRGLANKKKVLADEKVKLDKFALDARYAHVVAADGSKHHTALIAADDYTIINLVVLERKPLLKEEVLTVIRSLEVVGKAKPRTEAKNTEITQEEISGFLQKQSERGEASKEDLANIPRSEKPGEPSVGNSCNLITFQCYETAHSEIGKGYYSTKKQCTSINGNYSDAPCPAENRVGFCLLNDQQLISFYKNEHDTPGRHQALCQSYNGKWLGTPKVRPWPKNEG